jgi:hypothetical protein
MAVAQTAGPSEIEGRGGVREIIGGGLLAGIIGGMLMAMIMMMATAAGGMGLFAPLRLIAATLYGKDAMTGVAMMPVAWFVAHVAFGMGVGSAPALRRRFATS